jgi:hypothetical protein
LPIGLEELRVGHYVRIGDRWFEHPFLKSTFMIASVEEIAAIRAAGLAQVFFDPVRSNIAPPSIPVLQPAEFPEPPVLQPAAEPTPRARAARIPAAVPAEPPMAAPIAAPAEPPPAVLVAHPAERPLPAPPFEPAEPLAPAPVAGPADPPAPAAVSTPAPAPRVAPAPPVVAPSPFASLPPLDLRALRANLTQAREDYRAAVDGAAQALAMLDAGDALGQEATLGAVRQVLALAAGRERPLTLAPVPAPVGAQRRQAFMSMDAAALAAAVGRRLRLDAADLQALTTAAMVHAAGLSRLPPRLRDESRLQGRDELAEFRQYPRLGAALLREYVGFAPEVIRIVEQHRERLDGSGFPGGARGDRIHPLAPVVGAIREFQVLACREGPPMPAAALAQMYLRLRGAYGATTVEHVIAALTVYPPGSFVALSDGRLARVARVSDRARLAPLVWLHDEASPAGAPQLLDLSEPGGATVERVLDPRTLSEDVRGRFGGDWAGLTFPAPVAPPMGARPPALRPGANPR